MNTEPQAVAQPIVVADAVEALPELITLEILSARLETIALAVAANTPAEPMTYCSPVEVQNMIDASVTPLVSQLTSLLEMVKGMAVVENAEPAVEPVVVADAEPVAPVVEAPAEVIPVANSASINPEDIGLATVAVRKAAPAAAPAAIPDLSNLSFSQLNAMRFGS